jgi:hypothetical protein
MSSFLLTILIALLYGMVSLRGLAVNGNLNKISILCSQCHFTENQILTIRYFYNRN